MYRLLVIESLSFFVSGVFLIFLKYELRWIFLIEFWKY